jgi:hypothetical protein
MAVQGSNCRSELAGTFSCRRIRSPESRYPQLRVHSGNSAIGQNYSVNYYYCLIGSEDETQGTFGIYRRALLAAESHYCPNGEPKKQYIAMARCSERVTSQVGLQDRLGCDLGLS